MAGPGFTTNILDYGAAIIAAGLAAAVLYTFVVGQHYIIPTVILVPTLVFANLAWFGLRGARWAKYMLLNIACILVLHGCFGLVWAKTPRAVLGDGFYGAYGCLVLLPGVAAYFYARANGLYRRG